MSLDTKDKPVLFTSMSRPIMDSSLACCVHAVVRCKLLGVESSSVRQSVHKRTLIPAEDKTLLCHQSVKKMFFSSFFKNQTSYKSLACLARPPFMQLSLK